MNYNLLGEFVTERNLLAMFLDDDGPARKPFETDHPFTFTDAQTDELCP